MIEIWKKIKDLKGYEVSNLGNVRSVDRIITYKDNTKHLHKGALKTLRISTSGYLCVGLFQHNKQHMRYVHRLVAEAFLHRPKNTTQVDHLDMNKQNNKSSNLEWVTASENIKRMQVKYPIKKGEDASGAILTEKEVINIINLFNKGYSIKKVFSMYTIISKNNIQSIFNGRTWKHLDHLKNYDKNKYRNKWLKNNPNIKKDILMLRKKKFNISQISRDLNISRQLVRKVINNEVDDIVRTL